MVLPALEGVAAIAQVRSERLDLRYAYGVAQSVCDIGDACGLVDLEYATTLPDWGLKYMPKSSVSGVVQWVVDECWAIRSFPIIRLAWAHIPKSFCRETHPFRPTFPQFQVAYDSVADEWSISSRT